MKDLSESVLLIEFEISSGSFSGTLDWFFADTLVSLSFLVNFIICVTNSFPFSDTLSGLRPGTYLSELITIVVFRKNLGFGVNLSGDTLFDNLDKKRFDRGELISMPDEKCHCI